MPTGSEQAAAAARAAKKAKAGRPEPSKPVSPRKPSLISIGFQILKLQRTMKMNQTVVAKSAWQSKIVWTQVVSILAMALSFFGYDLDAQTQTEILAAIIAVNGVITWVLRTFFNNSVSPEMAGKTVKVQKA